MIGGSVDCFQNACYYALYASGLEKMAHFCCLSALVCNSAGLSQQGESSCLDSVLKTPVTITFFTILHLFIALLFCFALVVLDRVFLVSMSSVTRPAAAAGRDRAAHPRTNSHGAGLTNAQSGPSGRNPSISASDSATGQPVLLPAVLARDSTGKLRHTTRDSLLPPSCSYVPKPCQLLAMR